MSRYEIPAKKDDKYLVTVGWDAPMNTYFAQVFDRNQKYDTPVLWMGTSTEQVSSVKQLQEGLAPYATIPDETIKNMVEDRAHSPQPSPLQQRWRDMMSQSLADKSPAEEKEKKPEDSRSR